MSLEEEDARVSVLAEALGLALELRGHRHLVHAGLDDAVRPALEGVADVDDHLRGAVGVARQHGDERAWVAAVLELEAANGVLEQQGDDAEVGVRPRALDLALGELLQVRLGVVVEACLAGGGLAAVDERVLGDVEADLHGPHQLEADVLELQEAALHQGLEAWQLLLGRELVGVSLISWRATVEVLL